MATKKEDAAFEQVNADAPTYYTNAVALAVSPFDLTFAFGLRTGAGIDPQAKIVMSLEHAMVMLLVTRRSLREHLTREGIEIKLPEAVMRELQLDEESPLW